MVSDLKLEKLILQEAATQREVPQDRADEDALIADIIAPASQYGRYDWRRISSLLRKTGWAVNVTRVELMWRLEGLKVPQSNRRRGGFG